MDASGYLRWKQTKVAHGLRGKWSDHVEASFLIGMGVYFTCLRSL